MVRLEEELEGERARVRRLRKERDGVLAKHKQAMADKAQQLEAVAQSIRSAGRAGEEGVWYEKHVQGWWYEEHVPPSYSCVKGFDRIVMI